MKIRILAILVLCTLMLGLLSACEEAPKSEKPTTVTEEQAQQIAMDHAGISEEDVLDIHTHVLAYDGLASYKIHINVEGMEYEYIIAMKTGEILYAPNIL